MNLVTNAVQAVGEMGSVEISVLEEHQEWADPPAHLSAELPAGDYAVLCVADDGAGIDVRTLERMYDPFYTTKEFGHGTGLGLSVVHGVVSSHHGGIAVDSELGVGSRFRIYLPLVDAATSRAAEAGEEPVAVSPRTAHILLVDDEEMLADALSRGLEQAGFLRDVVERTIAVVTEQGIGMPVQPPPAAQNQHVGKPVVVVIRMHGV